MKKHLAKYRIKIYASFIISVIMVFSTFVGIPISANYTTAEDIYNKNSATYYFSSLTSNFGLNRTGTCTYVATASLLSYYDTYLSDAFISDSYTVKGAVTLNSSGINISSSPGISQETDWESSDYSSYGDFVDAGANEYFQLKLIQMGRDEKNFYFLSNFGNLLDALGFDRIVDENINPNIDWSISVIEAASLVEHYLEQQGLSDAITVHSESYKDYVSSLGQEKADEKIRNKTIALVNEGIPVVYAGFYQKDDSSKWGGHSLVAYDYDSANDKLVFHSGWNSDPVIKEGEASFKYYDRLYMMWLEVDSTKLFHNNNSDSDGFNCSDNYILTDGTTQTSVCMCKFDVHPNHTHTLSNTYSGYTSSGHYFDCKWCDYSLTESHSFIYLNYSSTQHKKKCACGYLKYAAHIIRDSTDAVVRCIYCNGIVESGGGAIIGMSVNSIQYITDNGSYVRLDGVIVISDLDYELYLSGELDLDSLVFANSCTH